MLQVPQPTILKISLSCSVTSFCHKLSQYKIISRSRSRKCWTNIILDLQDYSQRYILSYLYKPVKVVSLSRNFANFSVRFVYPAIVVEHFWCSNLWKMHLWVKNLKADMFIKFLSSYPRQMEIIHSPRPSF